MIAVGCVGNHEKLAPPVVLPSTFSADNRSETSPTFPLPNKWWESLDDPALSQLIEIGLKENFNLRAAWDRLSQAEAVLDRDTATLFPSLEVRSSNQRAEFRDFFGDQVRTLWRSNFIMRFTANYELDLWGKFRSTRNASELLYLGSQEEVQIAAVSISAEIATVWYQVLELLEQKFLLDSIETSNKKVLTLVTNRFSNGQISAVDLLQQARLAESVQSEKAVLEADLKFAKGQLAILLGKPPGDPYLELLLEDKIKILNSSEPYVPVEFSSIKHPHILPDLPSPVPVTGIPIEHLSKRPDVRQALMAIKEADYRVASAIADRFPQISLGASVGTNSLEVNNVLKQWLYGLTGTIVGPIIDGGRRRAEVRRNEAILSERINTYGDILIRSYNEVDSALIRENRQRDALKSLNLQSNYAKKALVSAWKRYLNGNSTYLEILTTQISYTNTERELLRAKRALLDTRIALMRAMADGLDIEKPDARELEENQSAHFHSNKIYRIS